MHSHRHQLVAFVLEASSSLPPTRRIAVLRGLADVVGSSGEQFTINSLADSLQAAEQRLQEFAFQFNQKQPQP